MSENPDSASKPSRAAWHRWLEFPIVAAIYVCGWSAIIFVFAIFLFVFKEAVPVFWGEPATAVAEIPGPNNDLSFCARQDGEMLNETEIVLRPVKGGPVALVHEKWDFRLIIDVDPDVTTANQIVEAAAASPVDKILRIELTAVDEFDGGSPNDGSGKIAPDDDSFDLFDGRSPLDLKEFFTSPTWLPASDIRPQYGILALLIGSLAVTALAMLLAVPFGLGAAVYVSEFCSGRVKETLKVVIELLAAIPSVVWGFIGVMVLNPIIINLTGAPIGLNLLNAGIILALMSVPIMVSVGEDALKAVPDSYREAALSLGASRWEIVYRVLFPAAKNGLLAAVLLGVGRAIGETMAVLMATGHSAQIPHSLLDPIGTLTATIAAELGETVKGDEHYRVLFLIGVILFAITFVVNLIADLVVKGFRSEKAA